MYIFYFSLFCLLTSVYIPSGGGSGVSLGYNLLFLLGAGVMLIAISFKGSRYYREKENQNLILAGVLFIILLWIFQVANSLGCIALLLVFLCWWLSQTWFISEENKNQVLLVIFFLAIAQSAIALLQVFSPELALHWYEYSWLSNHGRPYGIFQQVNLLASFLATGLGCGFLLMLKEKRIATIVAYIIGLAGITFTLTINQSRAGMLGALVVIAALLLLQGNNKKREVFFSLVVMAISAIFGSWVVTHTHVLVNGQFIGMGRAFEGSNHERLYILKNTLEMIALKPWFGWGYGSFEHEFSRYVINHSDQNHQYHNVITHPHNELLYAWFQGGVVAVVGVLLLLCGWIKNITAALRKKNVGYALLILPFLIHLNVEYPFYQSFIHLAVFVILLRIGEQDVRKGEISRYSINKKVTAATGTGLILFSLVAICTHYQLTRYEREGYEHFPTSVPWYFVTQNERAQYDGMVALLMHYNKSHNAEDLAKFMTKAKAYSSKHNDKNIWLSMITIERYQGNGREAYHLIQQYQALFPDETR